MNPPTFTVPVMCICPTGGSCLLTPAPGSNGPSLTEMLPTLSSLPRQASIAMNWFGQSPTCASCLADWWRESVLPMSRELAGGGLGP